MPVRFKTQRVQFKNPSTGEYDDLTASALPVDYIISGTSENPVQNKVIKQALDQKADSTFANSLASAINSLDLDLRHKQDKPNALGTPGAVVGLDENLNPVWLDKEYAHNYELIADATTNEDLTEFHISSDIDGNPFLLSDLFMIVNFTVSTTGSDSYVFVTAGSKTYNNTYGPTVYFPSQQSIRTAAGQGFYFTQRFGENLITSSIRARQVDTTFDTTYTQYNYVYNIRGICDVYLQQYGEQYSLIPAGTNVKIYGVRA